MAGFRALISGRVQGVGFRYFAVRKASALGLTGYAKNLPDGSVEVVAEGDRTNLGELIKALEQGPSYSGVTGVEVEWKEKQAPEYSDFSIKY